MLPAGFACITAVVLPWLTAPIQRLPVLLGGPDCQVFIHGLKWVSHVLPSRLHSAFLDYCSGTPRKYMRYLKDPDLSDEDPESHLEIKIMSSG